MQQGKSVIDAKTGEPVRKLQPPQGWEQNDADLTVWSTKETVDAGHSVLIFCGTKRVRALSVYLLQCFWAATAGLCWVTALFTACRRARRLLRKLAA